MEFHVGTARHPRRQFGHAVAAPEHVELALHAELLGDRQQVNGLGFVEQSLNGAEYLSVRLHVKALRLEHIDHGIHCRFLHHHGPQDHLLQLFGLGLHFGPWDQGIRRAHEVARAVG